MSIFSNCESCNKLGTLACGCEDPPRFFCDSHAMNHILSGGKHSIEPALESLTSLEVFSMEDAYNKYRLSSLGQAIRIRNSRIEHLLQEIRKTEEECSSVLETILSEPIARDFQQIFSYKALPLFSDSSAVRSLLDLKHASDFSSLKILDLLNTLNSSFLSSFPSFFSSQTSSIQTSPPSTACVKMSPVSSLTTQIFSSQIDIVKADTINYRWELFQQVKAHDDWITSIAVSDCEKYVASASNDNTINIFELQTMCKLRTLIGHKFWVTSVGFVGDKIVSGSMDKTIKIWEEDRCVNTLNLHSGYVNCVFVSSCKRLIVSGSYDKTAVVFRLEDNKTLHILAHSDGVLSVAFSQSDKEIVSGTHGGKISIWKTETGELLEAVDLHTDYVTCVKYPGKFIVSSSQDKTVKFWDRDKKLSLLTFTDHTQLVRSVDLRDNVFASLGHDDRIVVRDIRSGTLLQTLQGHGISLGGGKIGLKILEGAKFIVSGGGDRNVNVWRRVD